jgi:hypothetical protein
MATRAEDRKIMQALMRHVEELDEFGQQAFPDMFDRLESGRQQTLTPKQRSVAEKAYYKLGLEREEPAANLVSTGKVKVTEAERKDLKKFLDSLGPRPLKPPGRA